MSGLGAIRLCSFAAAVGITAGTAVTITLGQDTDYPPYASKDAATGELTGLGVDVANAMNAMCTDVQINMVETDWANCWSSANGGQLGASLIQGGNGPALDGCMTYMHTQGVRDTVADFSGGILSINKAAGFITKLVGGQPRVAGSDNLSGKNIVDVGGWAPTADTVAFVENKCTCSSFAASTDYTMLTAPSAGDGVDSNPNDIALKMVLNETADVMYVYADQASNYNTACTGGDTAGKDCALWSQFGTNFAYVGTGKYGYMRNGTTLIISRKNSGIVEQVEPCFQRFLQTREYYDICVRYNFVSDCFPNSFFPNPSCGERRRRSEYNMRTHQHETSCENGYCGCDAPVAGTTTSTFTTDPNCHTTTPPAPTVDATVACTTAAPVRTRSGGGGASGAGANQTAAASSAQPWRLALSVVLLSAATLTV